ncbi:hypothetical protein N0V91_008118 [Didymella pomorum]|uniref:Uncharacterized protein n=1 Tax=Didymella pomorum TaxID=749634 RepID=A0A9W8Z7Y7_9PLEO|nr:hypothetical protein N0V91_008118 [Didymella pomorum]
MLKRYTMTCIEGVKYLHGNRNPTRRLVHGGIDVLPFLSKACCDASIFLDKAQFLIANNSLLDAFDKLFDEWGVFDDLVYGGHVTQIRMREIPTKYSWEEQEFGSY